MSCRGTMHSSVRVGTIHCSVHLTNNVTSSLFAVALERKLSNRAGKQELMDKNILPGNVVITAVIIVDCVCVIIATYNSVPLVFL